MDAILSREATIFALDFLMDGDPVFTALETDIRISESQQVGQFVRVERCKGDQVESDEGNTQRRKLAVERARPSAVQISFFWVSTDCCGLPEATGLPNAVLYQDRYASTK